MTFQFNTSRAKVQDYRYDAEKKVLNVYLAGTEALFAEGADTLIKYFFISPPIIDVFPYRDPA